MALKHWTQGTPPQVALIRTTLAKGGEFYNHSGDFTGRSLAGAYCEALALAMQWRLDWTDPPATPVTAALESEKHPVHRAQFRTANSVELDAERRAVVAWQRFCQVRERWQREDQAAEAQAAQQREQQAAAAREAEIERRTTELLKEQEADARRKARAKVEKEMISR